MKGAPPRPRLYGNESTVRAIPDQSDEPDCRPRPRSTRRHKQQDCNTNILMLKLGVLSKPCKSHTGDPVVCSNDQCTAILNYKSKITEVEGGPKKVRVLQDAQQLGNTAIVYYRCGCVNSVTQQIPWKLRREKSLRKETSCT